MGKTYSCTLEVRGYELDSFGHVNHSVYVNYLEHARWKILEEEGVTSERFKEWNAWPIIAAIEVNYLKPTYMGDRLEVRSRATEPGRTNFVFEQTILDAKTETPVVQAKVRIVIVNDKGRPSAMPPLIEKLWGKSA